jgi:transcriptional antiterminator RfaH
MSILHADSLRNLPLEEQQIDNFWVALQVRPQCEQFVAVQLRNKGYEEFLPTCQTLSRSTSARGGWRQAPLFVGYLFCRYIQNSGGGLIVTTPGVIRILGLGGKPAPICDGEIAALRMITSPGVKCSRSPYVEVGQVVRISSGPLSGITGILSRVAGKDRLVVCVEILRRGVAVQVDAMNVVPVTPHPAVPN